jgi:hypothetical protein
MEKYEEQFKALEAAQHHNIEKLFSDPELGGFKRVSEFGPLVEAIDSARMLEVEGSADSVLFSLFLQKDAHSLLFFFNTNIEFHL